MAEGAVLYCPRCLTTFGEELARCPNLGCGDRAPPEGWGSLLEIGAVFDRHYRVLAHLAVGGGGITYKARELDATGEETGPSVAIKVLYSGRDQGGWLKRLATEAQILQELDHPNIVELRGFVHRAGHPPYLLTRFEEGGTLMDLVRRLGPLPPRVAAAIGRQVGWALQLAHERGVIHRDLKPENVLLTERVGPGEIPTARVADFGIAKVMGGLGAQTRLGAFVGTPAYAAPEQLAGAPPTPATDVYGLGALLFFCTTGGTLLDMDAPATWEERREALVARLPAKLRGNDPDTHAFNALLAATLVADPADRLGLEQLDALFVSLLGGVEAEEGQDAPGETLAYALGESALPPLPKPTWGIETKARPANTPLAHTAWVPPAVTPRPAPPLGEGAVVASPRPAPVEAPPLVPPVVAPNEGTRPPPRPGAARALPLLLLGLGLGVFVLLVGLAALALVWMFIQ